MSSRAARARLWVANACGWLSAVFFAAMMLLTVADVSLRLFANRPIRGSFEIVELLLACGFFLALPATFLREENIIVDVIDGIWPSAVRFLRRLALVLSVAILGLMAWRGIISARDAVELGDVTSDLSLPRIYYWIPVLAGMIGAALTALVMLFARDEKKDDA